MTRRRFLSVAAGAAATLLVRPLAAFPSSRGRAGTTRVRFRSRPDLAPPVVKVVTPARGTAAGHILVAPESGAADLGPMIVDDDGVLVWFRPVVGATAMNLSVQRYRDAPVLAWWEGRSERGHGAGEYVLVGTDYRELARVRAGNGLDADFHDFELTPQGTALLTAYDERPFDLTALGGPADGTLVDSVVQEVDVASGRVVLEWRASDHIGFDESYAGLSGTTLDLAHLNSVSLDTDGNLLVSARHTWTVYKVDRSSGSVVWRLGGKRSDFALGDGARFAWQHDVQRAADGTLTVFDNGAGPTQVEPASRGLRLRVDEGARTAELLQAFLYPGGLLASATGSMESLPDGGAFVGWGSVPAFSEFGPGGELRFHAVFVTEGVSYRALRQAWTGTPAERPALVVARDGKGRAAFASWNGATEVAGWRLRTGTTRRTVSVRHAAVAKRSFETRIPLPAGARWVAVDALDRRGAALGSAHPVVLGR